jgi:hypothetical protein
VAGEPANIERLQRSSARYFQRPDATHVALDPTRRTLDGGSGGLSLSKGEGRWTFEVSTGFESPETERNDIGSLQTADGRFVAAYVGYRKTKPGFFYRWETGASVNAEENYAGEVQQREMELFANVSWRNFWETSIEVEFSGSAQDQRLTRGGPTMGKAPGWSVDLSGGNAFQSPTRFSLSLEAAGDDDGGSRREVSGTLSLQASPRVSLQINPTFSESTTARQYVDTLAAGRAATFGQRYIFAAVDQRTFLMQFRASLVLKPDLTLDVYAEPFAASGRYRDHGELLAPRSRQLRLHTARKGRRSPRARKGLCWSAMVRTPSCAGQQRLPRTLVPQQRGPALGISARLHVLRGVAAGPVELRPLRARRRVGPVRFALGPRRQHLRPQSQLLLGRAVAGEVRSLRPHRSTDLPQRPVAKVGALPMNRDLGGLPWRGHLARRRRSST